MTTPRLDDVLDEVAQEVARQYAKFGDQLHVPDGTGDDEDMAILAVDRDWVKEAEENGTLTRKHILQEEVSEAFAESKRGKLRQELIQVAAVCCNWIEAIDRASDTGAAEDETDEPEAA